MKPESMLAADVMTREVTTVQPRTRIADAVAKMVASRVSGLPVLHEAGKLIGILTEGDLLRRVELGTAPHHPAWLNFLRGPGLAAKDYVHTHTLVVEDVMTPEPSMVEPFATLEEVVRVMEHKHVRRVPVVLDEKLVGIVSRADLVRALGQLLAVPTTEKRPDPAIQAEILAELERQGWHTMCKVTIEVRQGRVTLAGIAQSASVHRALCVAAEGIAGVISVDNKVTVLDPMVTAIGA